MEDGKEDKHFLVFKNYSNFLLGKTTDPFLKSRRELFMNKIYGIAKKEDSVFSRLTNDHKGSQDDHEVKSANNAM